MPEAIPFSITLLRGSLEVELHSQLDNAIALLRGDGPEIRTAIRERPVCVLRK